MPVKDVNFFAPGTDAGLDFSQVQRQRLLADILSKQGMTGQQGQMVGNIYVPPAPLSYVNQLASALGGGFMQRQADQNERDILQRAQQQRAQEASDFLGAMNGKPGMTTPPIVPNDDEGNPMPAISTPGIAPDRNRALAIALQSANPALQAMGGKIMDQQMTEQQLKDIMSQYGGAGGSAVPGGAGGQGGGGVPPGVNPLAFALTGSGNPTFGKLGTMIQDAAKPQTVAPGGTVYVPGQGPIFTAPMAEPGIQVQNVRGGGQAASPVANYAQIKAQQEGAIAQARQAAESANTMVTVDVGGKPVQMTRAQFLGMTNGTPAPDALPRAQPGVTGSFVGSENDILAAINGIRDPQERANATAAYAQQRQNGQVPVKSPNVPGIAGQTAGDKQYEEARSKDYAAQAKDLQSAGKAARGVIGDLDSLEALYKDPNIAKGAAAESISALKNAGASLGVEVKGLGAEQAIQAITNKMALNARSTAEGGGMPGAMSDADRNFLKAQQPGLEKTPEGRALIIANNRKLAQRQVEVARMANEYERTHGRLDAGFDQQLQAYADSNPMFANQKMPSTPKAPSIQDLAAQELARRRKAN